MADRKNCPKCGKDNRADAKYCRGCGYAFKGPQRSVPITPRREKQKKCSNCGAMNNPAAKWCSNCGKYLGESKTV